MKAYTYLIRHKPTNRFYYGFRSANTVAPEDDLWQKYFTSSPRIKELINETGVDSFETQIRKVFDTQEQAVAWEIKVLRRMRVLENDQWINQNIAGYVIPDDITRQKISEYHKGKPKTKEHKQKIKEGNQGQSRPWAIHNLPADVSGENNGMYGKQHSEDTKRKISEANRGKTPANKGVSMSEEQKAKISETRRSNPTKLPAEVIARRSEKIRGQKREKKYCPHCDRMIAIGWYNRHGDNCKH
jgi:hypothetical protein